MQTQLHRFALTSAGLVLVALLFHGAAQAQSDNGASIYMNRALAEQARGDLKSAIADFSKAIELKPDYIEAYKKRAAAEYAKGDIYSSRKDEAKAAELQKNSSGPGVANANSDLPDISLATCPDSPPSFLPGETYRAYSGCARARGEVAILTLKSGVDGLDKAVSTRLDVHTVAR